MELHGFSVPHKHLECWQQQQQFATGVLGLQMEPWYSQSFVAFFVGDERASAAASGSLLDTVRGCTVKIAQLDLILLCQTDSCWFQWGILGVRFMSRGSLGSPLHMPSASLLSMATLKVQLLKRYLDI